MAFVRCAWELDHASVNGLIAQTTRPDRIIKGSPAIDLWKGLSSLKRLGQSNGPPSSARFHIKRRIAANIFNVRHYHGPILGFDWPCNLQPRYSEPSAIGGNHGFPVDFIGLIVCEEYESRDCRIDN